MSHFAKVVDGIVEQVIVAEQDFIDTLPDSNLWIQTSYNTHGGVHYDPATGEPSADQTKALRGNYAGIGYSYDYINDVFIPPKPFQSWNLNNTTWTWEAPTPYPQDGKPYVWDEATRSWNEVAIPA